MKDNPVFRLYEALSRGDVAVARACCLPGAVFWHGFDGIAQDLDTAARGWEGLIANTRERHGEDVRLSPTPDGFVQQFVFVVRTPNGERKAWPLCVVVKIQAGLIARVDEYIDRAGSFTPPDGQVKTPGF